MGKLKTLLLSASSAIALLLGASAPIAYAADSSVQACQTLAGTVTAGYIFGDLSNHFSGKGDDDDDDDDDYSSDYGTFFGEGEVLYHFCDTNLNVQGDFAFHSHQFDVDAPFDVSDDRWHVGGILFWRDQDVGVLGIDASFINDDFIGKNFELSRVGVRGEFFGGDMLTLGAGAGFLSGEFFGKDSDGYDVNAWGRLYPTENIGLLARLDYSTLDVEGVNLDQWAVGGEGEYLLPNIPMSIFAGARYSGVNADGMCKGCEFSAEDTQFYAGLTVYFGSDGNGGSLASHHRNNTLDNTSVLFERLPNPFLFFGKGPV